MKRPSSLMSSARQHASGPRTACVTGCRHGLALGAVGLWFLLAARRRGVSLPSHLCRKPPSEVVC